MDKITSSLGQEIGNIGNNATSAATKEKNGRKGSQLLPSKRYPLRSAESSARLLRSTSKDRNKTHNEPVIPLRSAHSSSRALCSTPKNKKKVPSKPVNDPTVQPATYKRKRGRPSKGVIPKNDYIRIRQRVRYILNRMNYEQSLIQAYASEGWKGQSLEKIRPEKELERAKAEILRCKLRIREAFQNMDSLLSEGKLEESLFDSEGEISSEDIFCAICGLKHVMLKNDIILCDGACNRGFHQKCLNPPLLAKDIPPGDEGWLCPACDCKLECIDVLNELQGSTLCIHDSWEKVFPESVLLENGSKQIGASDLPSDDSEDNDYDPILADGNMVNESKSSSEDGSNKSESDNSDFMTSSNDSQPSKNEKSESSKNKTTVDDLGLPSEDSQDDDFNPAGPDSSEDQKDSTNSDDSDFTSDSDDFCAEIAKSCGQDKVTAPSVSYHSDGVEISNVDNQPSAEEYGHDFMEKELDQDMVLPVSSRRQVECLDYKKLYDESYGKESSDSSDDEEWSGDDGNGSETDSLSVSPQSAKACSRRAQAERRKNNHTPLSEQPTGVVCSNGSGSTVRKRHFGPVINQKLQECFKKDPYPSRVTKESLAEELGLTFNQVSTWFSSTRHYTRVASAKKEKCQDNCSAENNDTVAGSLQQSQPNAVEKIEHNNLNEGNKEDVSFIRQGISCEQTVLVTPVVNQNQTTYLREVSWNVVAGGNQHTGASRIPEDTPYRQDIGCEQAVVLTPTVCKNVNTNSSEVTSTKNVAEGSQRSDTSMNVGSSIFGSVQNKVSRLELADEARRKAILRELRKRKAGR